MKSHPMTFTGEEVRAILEGRKTQTRRILKPQPPDYVSISKNGGEWQWEGREAQGFVEGGPQHMKYQPGDEIWVRETWCKFVPEHVIDSEYAYKADSTDADGEEFRQSFIRVGYPYKWKSPIYMPRSASRITLEVESVRIERLGDLSEIDAKAEGASSITEIRITWERINKLWNPKMWVVVLKFRKV